MMNDHQTSNGWAKGAAGWLATALLLLIIDLIWLGFVARDFYAEALGPLLRPEAYKPAAAAFYIFYTTTVWFYAVRDVSRPSESAKRGAALGALSYGVYELTNWAVIVGWPAILVPVDWGWGIILTAVSAFGAKSVAELVGKNR